MLRENYTAEYIAEWEKQVFLQPAILFCRYIEKEGETEYYSK